MDIKNAILDHISIIKEFSLIENITEESLSDLYNPLINSIDESGVVKYLIEKDDRYRASPLATCIIWLNRANLLPRSVIAQMNDALLFLRNNTYSKNTNHKYKIEASDKLGWSQDEGVSVWSTSFALTALLETEYFEKKEEFIDSIFWLADQQNKSGGWSYQAHNNCIDSNFITGLVLQTLSLVIEYKSHLNLSAEQLKRIIRTVNYGLEYACDAYNSTDENCWCFKGKAHAAASVYMLDAFSKISQLQEIKKEHKEFYDNNKKSIIRCILNLIPKDASKWAEELIVSEGGAKYSRQKVYACFMPSLCYELMNLGVSPFNSKIVNRMRWLLKDRNNWRITWYDTENNQSFSHAMALSILIIWLSNINKKFNNIKIISQSTKSAILKKFILGFKDNNEQKKDSLNKKREKKRFLLFLAILLLLIGIFFAKTLWSIFLLIVTTIFQFCKNNFKEFVITLGVTILVSISTAIIKSLIKLRQRKK